MTLACLTVRNFLSLYEYNDTQLWAVCHSWPQHDEKMLQMYAQYFCIKTLRHYTTLFFDTLFTVSHIYPIYDTIVALITQTYIFIKMSTSTSLPVKCKSLPYFTTVKVATQILFDMRMYCRHIYNVYMSAKNLNWVTCTLRCKCSNGATSLGWAFTYINICLACRGGCTATTQTRKFKPMYFTVAICVRCFPKCLFFHAEADDATGKINIHPSISLSAACVRVLW